MRAQSSGVCLGSQGYHQSSSTKLPFVQLLPLLQEAYLACLLAPVAPLWPSSRSYLHHMKGVWCQLGEGNSDTLRLSHSSRRNFSLPHLLHSFALISIWLWSLPCSSLWGHVSRLKLSSLMTLSHASPFSQHTWFSGQGLCLSWAQTHENPLMTYRESPEFRGRESIYLLLKQCVDNCSRYPKSIKCLPHSLPPK